MVTCQALLKRESSGSFQISMPNCYLKNAANNFHFRQCFNSGPLHLGHISEVFDHWDNTFRTGNDIEYSTVMVALVVGALICFAHLFAATPYGLSASSKSEAL
jgi:hypothetical protein